VGAARRKVGASGDSRESRVLGNSWKESILGPLEDLSLQEPREGGERKKERNEVETSQCTATGPPRTATAKDTAIRRSRTKISGRIRRLKSREEEECRAVSGWGQGKKAGSNPHGSFWNS